MYNLNINFASCFRTVINVSREKMKPIKMIGIY